MSFSQTNRLRLCVGSTKVITLQKLLEGFFEKTELKRVTANWLNFNENII